MSISRQRMLAAMSFSRPDRLPAFYHASPAGLHVHGQRLLDLFNRHPPDNPITFDHVPQPPAGTVDAQGRYHELRQDEWGTTWEWLIFGLHGHPVAWPFPDWEAAADYAFPPMPSTADPGFAAEKQRVAGQKPNFFIERGGISLFERLCALRPMDEVLMDLLTGDRHLLAFLDRLVKHWRGLIDYYLTLGVDGIFFGDDWGAQDAPLISPELFRNIFQPRYAELFRPIKRNGVKVMFHSCGWLGDILNELLDLGIDLLWPQIRFYDRPALVAKCAERRVTAFIHPDRQRLIPLGTPREIETQIKEYAERYHRLGGGAVFYIEIENDAPFENVRALIAAVDQYR